MAQPAPTTPKSDPSYPGTLPDAGSAATEWALDIMHGARKKDAWVTTVIDINAKAEWTGNHYVTEAGALSHRSDAGHYVCVGILKPGSTQRIDDNVEAVTGVVFDDVGVVGAADTKLDIEWFKDKPEPTFIVETSAGNHQFFFVFDGPIDPNDYRAFVSDLKKTPAAGGIKDGTSLTRYVRLPSGRNPKANKGGFQTRLVAGSGKKHSLADLMVAFGVAPDDSGSEWIPSEDEQVCGNLPPDPSNPAAPAAPLGSGVRGNKTPPVIPESLALPEDQALALLDEVEKLIENNHIGREDWVGIVFGFFNASGRNDEVQAIVERFTAKRKDGPVNPADDSEVVWGWRNKGETKAGLTTLIRWLEEQGTPEATRMVERINQIQAKTKFDPVDNGDNFSSGQASADPDPAGAAAAAKTRWHMLRDATRSWPSRGKVAGAGGDGNVARLKPGVAVFGKDAKTGPARERMFITNRLARGLVSVLNGIPGQGKTAIAVAYMNAIACEKPLLVGLTEIRRAGACAYMAADSEKADEFKRRDEAFRQRHRLTSADYKHNIYVFDEPGAFLEQTQKGEWVPTLWIIEQAKFLADLREKNELAVIVVDTLSGMAGGGKLNDDSDMQAVMAVARALATGLDCAIDLINHLTKGGAKADPESMDAGGGARALTATPRFVTNVIDEVGGLIRLHAAKGSYRDGPRGMEVLKWGEEMVPVEVWEEGVLEGISTSAIGVLVPENPLVLAQTRENVAVQAIADALQKGVKVIRSKIARGGRPGKDHAIVIVQKTLPGLSAKGVDELIGTLIDQGRLVQVNGPDEGRKRSVDEITLPRLVDEANI